MLSVSRAMARRTASLLPQLGMVRSFATETNAPSTPAPAGKPVLEKEFLVYRWNPDSGEDPTYQSYKVDINA